ncbi:MAG: AI-2E family transporter, partial [Planctomycetaceae bacterium]
GEAPSAGQSLEDNSTRPSLASPAPPQADRGRAPDTTELTPDLAGNRPLAPEIAPERPAQDTALDSSREEGQNLGDGGTGQARKASRESPEDSTATTGRTADAPRRSVPDRSIPERPALARSGLTELFRVSSQDVLNYVFSHGMDAAELIVMVFFYLVFLFLGSRKFGQRILRAFPGERGQRVLAVGQGISESMERFMMVKTVVGLGMAISSAVIMWFFGLDHWLLWAFLFFASNYITYIGSIAACVPPCVMAFLDLDSPTLAAVLGGLIILNRLFWIDFVELRLSGQQLNLDPTVLFLWLAYWGWTWGILGLILAYPMMAAVRIALLHIEEARGWSVMLSDE